VTQAIPAPGWRRFPWPASGRGIAGRPAGHWRTLLESRWRAELERVTELSLEFAGAAERSPRGQVPRQLEHRAVAARRHLADIEDALDRLSAGRYGRCEQCGAGIPARRLERAPETRYCVSCGRRHGRM
jgi:RNA polymerase-binding transcription factor DksA